MQEHRCTVTDASARHPIVATADGAFRKSQPTDGA